ncbi:MAG TPA: class I SAM-dependent methyltransferase [Phycisphaerae bacterium]|nr:class I SAM-dependent methyltransferase [Phycisphaerae bacterium]
MASTTCIVCGHNRWEPHLEILRRCVACGFVTAAPNARLDARRLYEGAYFKGEEYLDYLADEPFFRRNFRKRLRHVLKWCPEGRLLEIGSAYGFFLDMAREHYSVVGFEVNGEAARHARETFKLDVHTSDFLQAGMREVGGMLNATVMWDVIEHLERPDRHIALIGKLSRPGAILCLTTGDIGSRLARHRGRKWRLIHPPTHLHYFSRETITRLLANHGFRVVDLRTVGFARSFRQILYSVLALRLGFKGVHEFCRKITPPSRGITLNTLDIMQVTAQKET